MLEGVKNMRPECESLIYSHINPEAPLDYNKLKFSYNDDPKSEYFSTSVSINKIIPFKALWEPNSFQELDKLARNRF